ncbi:MAG TPA: aspartate kinase [Candidatus Acidoferrales bacterium]|nr:aspartate kinase [Candidatus Acidoferrales bacterium]
MVTTTGPAAPQTRSTNFSTQITAQTATAPSIQTMAQQRARTLVVKFGGSSLADKDRVSKAAHLIAKESAKGARIVVVVSAMGKTTDQLISLIKHDSTLDKTDTDDILAMGERTSVRVFASALKSEGLDAKYFDPSDANWPIITDDNFSDANPLVDICVQKVREHVVPLLDSGTVPVIAGFVGCSTDRRVSTIGRGGSDTTAFIMAKGIGADEVVLVTDADGILSADPKLISNAHRLDRIDVHTLIGLADSGTKFIHRKALRYKDSDIPVRVISNKSDDLEAKGTIITGGIASEIEVTFASNTQAMAVTVAGKGISENPDILADVVRGIRKHSTLLGLSANFDSVIFYIPQTASNTLLTTIHDLISGYGEALAMAVQSNLAFLKVKGVGLEDTPGIIGRISTHLRENNINIYGMLTLASSIIVFVAWDNKELALDLMKLVAKGELQ